MAWTKLYSDKWLFGKIRKYRPEIRAVWMDLQAQADLSIVRGCVGATATVGYPPTMLAKMWNTPLQTLEEALEAFKKEKWIEMDENYIIKLTEWLCFQDEYQRIKKYRVINNTSTNAISDTEKGTEKNTGKDTEKDTAKDTEKDTAQIQIQNQIQNQIQIQESKDHILYNNNIIIQDQDQKEKKERKKKEAQQKDADARFKPFLNTFNEIYLMEYPTKYDYQQKDFKQLKDLLKRNKDLTLERFIKAVKNCLVDTFHRKNFTLCYVCTNFSKLENYEYRK